MQNTEPRGGAPFAFCSVNTELRVALDQKWVICNV